MHKNLWILAFAAVLVIPACKKDLTRTEILTDGHWKLTALTVDPAFPIGVGPSGVITTNDVYKDFLEDCAKDDYLTFYSDFNMLQNEGASKCNNLDPQTHSGTWTFKTGDTQLETTINGTTRTYAIVSMDEDKIVATYKNADIAGNQYDFTATYGRP